MNTVAVANVVPPAPPPPPPVPASGSSFSDLLASNLASSAALLLTPTLGIETSTNQSQQSASSSDTSTNTNGTATVAIPVPLPHQQNTVPPNGSDGSAGGNGSAAQSANAVPPSATAGASGNSTTGTGSGNGGEGQNPRGAALPPTAAQLNARVAAGAQGLISQPASNLASLAHTAQTVTSGGTASPAPTPASTAATAAAQHGTTAPDPDAMLKSGTNGAAGVTPDAASAEQSAAQTTAQSVATAEQRSIASAGAAQTGTDPTTLQADPSANSVAPPVVPQTASTLAAAPQTQGAAASTLAASTLDQIAFSLRQSTRSGLNQIEIQLKPASLGSIDVKLEMTHDGRMTAVISSDRSDTLNLLQRNSGELQQALRDAGLQTDTGSLSFNLRGEQQQPGSQGQQSGYLAAAAPADPALDEVPAQAVAAAAGVSSAHTGLLNIQV